MIIFELIFLLQSMPNKHEKRLRRLIFSFEFSFSDTNEPPVIENVVANSNEQEAPGIEDVGIENAVVNINEQVELAAAIEAVSIENDGQDARSKKKTRRLISQNFITCESTFYE